MKLIKSLQFSWMAGSLALACAFLSTATTTRANVYATDIKIDGTLTNVTVPVPHSGVATISYILNEPATLGVTIQVLSGATVVDTISIASPNPGTLRGLNSVPWGVTNNAGTALPLGGTYSLSITAAATGYTNWTQTSIDTNSGMPANYPLGIDVDKNPNSIFYGRVVMGCASTGANANTPAAAKQTGLFKMNADGTQADEGWYGNANYLTDDGGDTPVAGQMPGSGGYNPMKIRIADDDRIYWVDNSKKGAIIACDMQATTNQIVINEAGYASNPDVSDLSIGFQVFDVAFVTTPNASLWLGDNDYPSWGYWMYHMVNGAVDPADTGTQAVTTGGDLAIVSSSGLTVDTNLDIFCGQARNNENAFYDAMVFPNWNAGVLPPESGGFNYSTGTATGQVTWGYGCDVDTTCATDPSFESSEDTVINSRTSPTIVACPMGEGSQFSLGKTGGGIRLLNAQTGALITAGSQVLSNLDNGQAYPCAAWDNVGNLYGASTTRNLWRVWSPPGANTNTTVAVATMTVTPLPASASLAATAFSGNANGPAAPITASFFGSSPLTLQWYSIDLSNHTNSVAGQVNNTAVTSTLALNPLLASENGYRYFLVVSNSLGSATTTVATLTVTNFPVLVTSLPPAQEVPVGYAETLAVAANGALPLNYQWYKDGVLISGQTNASYSFTTTNGSHTFYVNVYNSANPAGINSSTTVIAPPTALSFSSTAGVNSSAGWDLNGGASFISPGVLQLTSGALSEARTAFYSLSELPINGFIATFTYQETAGPTGNADGVTFCVQGSGPTKVGGGGGSLAVSGISPSAEVEFNVYTGAAGGVGMSYNTGGGIGPNGPTGSVNMASGDAVNVTIIYTPSITNVYVNLFDTTTSATYTTNYSAASANITNVLGGNTAWVGFTGATGGADSTQNISNFLFQSLTNQVLTAGTMSSGNLPLTWLPATATLYQGPSVHGPWTLVGGTVTTNFVTGRASTTVTPAGQDQFWVIQAP